MPLTSQQDLHTFYADNEGYFTIDFVCDAGHGWISEHYSYDISEETWFEAVPKIVNKTNVKDENGTYRAYPYMIIKDLGAEETGQYISFGSNLVIDAPVKENEDTGDRWFIFEKYNPGVTLEIDNKTLFIHTSDGSNVLAGDNPMLANRGMLFKTGKGFYLEKGENIIYKRTLSGVKYPHYLLDLYFDFAVMQ